MISKELLSKVLNTRIDTVRSKVDTDNDVQFFPPSIEYDGFINIHELTHKCKEWAYNNGYYLTIYNDAIDIVSKTTCKIIDNITNDSFMYDVELVFKACQWILDNKET